MEDDRLRDGLTPKGSGTGEGGTLMTALPHCRAMGIELLSTEPGVAVLRLPYNEALIGDPETGVIGGGAVTALLDTGCGSAVISAERGILSTATLDLRIDYMRPATPGEAVIARAECYRVTRSVAFARAVAYHEDPETPIATASAAFIIERKPTKKASA